LRVQNTRNISALNEKCTIGMLPLCLSRLGSVPFDGAEPSSHFERIAQKWDAPSQNEGRAGSDLAPISTSGFQRRFAALKPAQSCSIFSCAMRN
jgi:hypothetical protein